MFVTQLKVDESVVIAVGETEVRIILNRAIHGRAVLLFDAPKEVRIHKQETVEKEIPK